MPSVDVRVENAVAIITIDRPQVRNAIDLPTARLVAEALDEVDGLSDIRAAVLTGSPTMFSAGMDLKAYHATGERAIVEGRGAFGICERATQKPIVAAVEGKALGGGFEIAMACDMIVAGDTAEFGLPEIARGLIAAAGGVVRLPRLIPPKIAMQLILTGETIGAADAARLGLVNQVVTAGTALSAAVALAHTVAANAPLAARTAKHLVTASATWADDELFDRQRPFIETVRASPDAAEGVRAFVEKRPPVWRDG